MLLKLITLFAIGLLTDVLWAWWIYYVASTRPVLAGCFGGLTALNGILLVAAVFAWEEARSPAGIGLYVLGCSIASWWSVRRQIK